MKRMGRLLFRRAARAIAAECSLNDDDEPAWQGSTWTFYKIAIRL